MPKKLGRHGNARTIKPKEILYDLHNFRETLNMPQLPYNAIDTEMIIDRTYLLQKVTKQDLIALAWNLASQLDETKAKFDHAKEANKKWSISHDMLAKEYKELEKFNQKVLKKYFIVTEDNNAS